MKQKFPSSAHNLTQNYDIWLATLSSSCQGPHRCRIKLYSILSSVPIFRCLSLSGHRKISEFLGVWVCCSIISFFLISIMKELSTLKSYPSRQCLYDSIKSNWASMDLCMYVYLRILCSKNEMSSLVIFMIRLPLSGIKNILISLLIMLAFFINHLVVRTILT